MRMRVHITLHLHTAQKSHSVFVCVLVCGTEYVSVRAPFAHIGLGLVVFEEDASENCVYGISLAKY